MRPPTVFVFNRCRSSTPPVSRINSRIVVYVSASTPLGEFQSCLPDDLQPALTSNKPTTKAAMRSPEENPYIEANRPTKTATLERASVR